MTEQAEMPTQAPEPGMIPPEPEAPPPSDEGWSPDDFGSEESVAGPEAPPTPRAQPREGFARRDRDRGAGDGADGNRPNGSGRSEYSRRGPSGRTCTNPASLRIRR